MFILIENDRQLNKLDNKKIRKMMIYLQSEFFLIYKKKKKERKQNGRKQARPQSSSAIEREERERKILLEFNYIVLDVYDRLNDEKKRIRENRE